MLRLWLALPGDAVYSVAMRMLVLMAFCALQLSVFTCGFDIHVHAADSDVGHVAEHVHDDKHSHEDTSQQEQASEHACHVHPSHTFTAFDTMSEAYVPVQLDTEYLVLSSPNLKNIPFSIEYPPKNLHS